MQDKQKCFKLHSEYAPTCDQPQAIEALAAQLYSEFKEFFPENAVEYFVSYYKKIKMNLYGETTIGALNSSWGKVKAFAN